VSAETDLYAILSADTYVNGVAGLRIYPDVVPLKIQIPSIASARVGTAPITTIHSGIPIARLAQLEVACMSTSRVAADELADLVEAALGGSNFRITERRADLDVDKSIWATVLTVDHFST